MTRDAVTSDRLPASDLGGRARRRAAFPVRAGGSGPGHRRAGRRRHRLAGRPDPAQHRGDPGGDRQGQRGADGHNAAIRARAGPPRSRVHITIPPGAPPRKHPCSQLAHDRTTHAGTEGHQTTQDDTWNPDPCVARATLGSGGREAVGVRVSPLALLLTCSSLLRSGSTRWHDWPSCSHLLSELACEHVARQRVATSSGTVVSSALDPGR